MQRLAGKTALITGGSSGIGLATARLFQSEGARVAITSVDDASLDKGLSSLAQGTAGYVMRAECLDDIRRVFDDLAAKAWALDILVPCAGIAPSSELEDADEALFDAVFGVNVKGVYFTGQSAVPLLRPGTSIVLLCSATHALGRKGRAFYAASKAAVRSLTRSLAAEFIDAGVRVNAVSPGPVMTSIQPLFGRTQEEQERRLAAMVPMQRMGTADEIAAAILFLSLPESAYMTGAEVGMDGGWGQGVCR